MHSPATVMASEFSRLSLVKVKAASERGGRGIEVNLNVVNMAVGARQAGLSVSQTADRLGFYNIQAFVVFTKGKKGQIQWTVAVGRKMSCWCQESVEKATVTVITTHIMSNLDAPDTFLGTRRQLCARNKVANEFMLYEGFFSRKLFNNLCILTCRLDYQFGSGFGRNISNLSVCSEINSLLYAFQCILFFSLSLILLAFSSPEGNGAKFLGQQSV